MVEERFPGEASGEAMTNTVLNGTGELKMDELETVAGGGSKNSTSNTTKGPHESLSFSFTNIQFVYTEQK
jgi:hypothetical protein